MDARVQAVASSGTHSFSKHVLAEIRLLAGLGVEGDAHAGVTVRHRYLVRRNPDAPNLSQVHLLHEELFPALAGQGIAIAAGEMGENVTTAGIDLLGLPEGTHLHLGPAAIVQVTGLRTPCTQMNALRPGLMKACIARDERGRMVRKAGVMAIVLASGVVRPGDDIGVEIPAGAHRPLGPV